MRNIALTALKRCGGYLPGQDFMANRVEAKALVALGRAEYRKEAVIEKEAEEVLEVPAEPVLTAVEYERPRTRKTRKSKNSE